ncbi:hypothetical protein PCANC_13851 [Puccinia coronata f. sp. avenae]|uniref:Uncharacterized protein n=1 Tax=Puccinia coronata f. sp. avenae TaxID=200324 RepID=A0A2N5TGL1_9BASI|nr:hypothetical protein PCASD_06166 [Puccinia coronata f. sp. avenae]PLW40941.1 hypothetical protein PCANC_13851 [Puccinia coronata f. sp. avenae]
MAVTLLELPQRVVRTIFELEPSLIHLFLVGLASKSLHQKTRDIVYQAISIHDLATPQDNQLLDNILNGPQQYALAVRSIHLISPSNDTKLSLQQQQQQQDQNHSVDSIPSIWDSNILTPLLTKLTNLKSFTWSTSRIPSHALLSLIGLHSPNLESFFLDIPSHPQQLQQISPPKQNGRQRAHTTSGWIEDSDDSDPELVTSKPARWDADTIEALSPTLTQLAISSLSVLGARNLAMAFQSLTWTSLTDLTLSKSLFIDDELMASIVVGSKKIKRLKIHGMSGTKLTERGIEHLFSGLDGLEEIELIDVEGRFSKVGWLKFDDLPPSLRSIKFGYHETGSYHSWTLDHLQNIVSLLGLYPQKLEHFSVTRLVPLPALLPGRHAMFPELGCNNRTAPQRISKQHILSIVADGKSLNELNLDWWLISVEGLEVIFKGLPNLRKLTALVDAPFHRIITSTVFVHSKIQVLKVSIPPEHTPLVQELSQVPITPTSASSKDGRQSSPSASHYSGHQMGSPGSGGSQSSPVPTRDLKKFIKRAGHLKEIIWTGRGGMGSWKFVRNGASALNVRVEFVPVAAGLPPEAFTYQQQQTHQPSGGGAWPAHHHRAGSAPRQYISGTVARSGPVAGGGGGGSGCTHGGRGGSRRTSSIATTEEGSMTNGSHSYSRRSSSASLATSWGSSSCAYLTQSGPASAFQRALGPGLEGIPGTPADLSDDEFAPQRHLDHHHPSLPPPASPSELVPLPTRAPALPVDNVLAKLDDHANPRIAALPQPNKNICPLSAT